MWLKCKWLSECRIACQPEALRGTASHHVWLQNGLYTLPLFLSLSLCVCVCARVCLCVPKVDIEAHLSYFVCVKVREGRAC